MKKDIIKAIRPTCVLVVRAGGKTFYASLENNPTARAFIEKLSPARITVCASDLDGAGKAGALPWDLPQCDGVTAAPGDVMLVDGDRIGVFYGESPRRFTRLGRIAPPSATPLPCRFILNGTNEMKIKKGSGWNAFYDEENERYFGENGGEPGPGEVN